MSSIVKGLKTHFFSDEGVSPAVDGVDLRVHKGETLSPTTWGSLRKVPPEIPATPLLFQQKTEKDYEEFLELLNKHDVRYCIIGADVELLLSVNGADT